MVLAVWVLALWVVQNSVVENQEEANTCWEIQNRPALAQKAGTWPPRLQASPSELAPRYTRSSQTPDTVLHSPSEGVLLVLVLHLLPMAWETSPQSYACDNCSNGRFLPAKC